ncbi:uncharacterized protein [Nicotiana tomentosiformis]|uniref:uncharacterized protein n=1 Tax=Nicotiana tomentosiformis TaxID=4098 RepID=UPI00388C8208
MGEELTLAHMMNLYSPKIFCGGMINLCKRGHHALLSSMDEDNDLLIIHPSFVSASRWIPLAVEGLDRWVQKILDVTMPETRLWKELAPKYGCLPASSVAAPEEDILADPTDAARLLQEMLTRIAKDSEKIQALSGECLLNNAMHNAATANFIASEGLRRLIMEKEELTSERDQLVVKRDQAVIRLSELETKAAEAVVLEIRLQQSEQKVETLSQEIAPMRFQFEEAKAKWAEVHNSILAASVREAASAERLNNLEAALNSKAKELVASEVKHAQLKEKHKRIIEHNKIFSSTVCELDVSLKSVRCARENLSAEVTQLKEELKHRATSLIVEKIYAMYSIRRKTLEEAKAGIIDFDAEIAKARELELAAKSGLPSRSDAPGPSDSDFKFSGMEKESEDDNDEG